MKIVPLVVSLLQSKGYTSPMGFNALGQLGFSGHPGMGFSEYGGGFPQFGGGHQPWLPFPQAAWSGFQGLPPRDIVHIVNTVTPIVASLVQSRAYQAQGGYNMPRAA